MTILFIAALIYFTALHAQRSRVKKENKKLDKQIKREMREAYVYQNSRKSKNTHS